MSSPFSLEQLAFLQRFVSSIVRSVMEEDSRSSESRVERNAASKPKARPKRKLRAPTEESIESSSSPKDKKPKESHAVADTGPSKPDIEIIPQDLILSRLRDLDSRAVIPRVVQAVQPAPSLPRFGCFRCGDPVHFIRDCPHPRPTPKPRKLYVAPCPPMFVQQERDVGPARNPHQNPDCVQISANPSLEVKDDQTQESQESVSK